MMDKQTRLNAIKIKHRELEGGLSFIKDSNTMFFMKSVLSLLADLEVLVEDSIKEEGSDEEDTISNR